MKNDEEELKAVEKEENKIELITIDDILNKYDDLKKRKVETKETAIFVKFFGKAFIAHSLDEEDLNDIRAKTDKDSYLGACYFIFLSIDKLQDDRVLQKYKCDNGAQLVKKIFTKPEVTKSLEILLKLNGLKTIGDIVEVSIENIKKK